MTRFCTKTPRVLPTALAGLLCALTACGGANYPGQTGDAGPTTTPVTPDPGLTCRPNLDGVVDTDELAVSLDVPARYRVSTQDRAVNTRGAMQDGTRVWDFSADAADDAQLTIAATGVQGWFADGYADVDGAYMVPFDAAGELTAVMQKQPGALRLLGVHSTENMPASGQTDMPYAPAVDVFRFPLAVGDAWTSTTSVTDGMLRGLPIAAQVEQRTEVVAEGRLILPDVRFEQVLQVVTVVTQQAVVGDPVVHTQVSFIAECFGEVARLTSPLGTDTLDFDTATEVRRLGF